MKKTIFIFLISLLTLTMSAQIQRNFFGNTLGVSTYAQVKAKMTQKGYKASSSDRNCVVYENVKFAGFTDVEAYLYFNKGKLYLVSLLLDKSFLSDSFDSKIELLRNKLLTKYSSYVSKSDFYDLVLSDDNTTSSLKRIYVEDFGQYMLTLTYMDNKIMDELSKKTSDEL